MPNTFWDHWVCFWSMVLRGQIDARLEWPPRFWCRYTWYDGPNYGLSLGFIQIRVST